MEKSAENLIDRDFQARAPNEKWFTDITEFQIRAGKVYRSPIVDCFDGLVISWSIGMHPDAELVNTMRDAAIEPLATQEHGLWLIRIAVPIIAGQVGFES